VLLLSMFEVCFLPSPAPLFGSMLIAAGFDMRSQTLPRNMASSYSGSHGFG
jgi:hypothetical protein